MRIGVDGKRALRNITGLGQYSRGFIDELDRRNHELFIFSQKENEIPNWSPPASTQLFYPTGTSFLWRTVGMAREGFFGSLDIYHGLSHEIPIHPKQKRPKLVVTMHDCIFKRFPKYYGWWDRKVYHQKWKYAVQRADAIISISQATADDLIRYYDADASKISVNPIFADPVFHNNYSAEEIQSTLSGLPFKEFFLFVGTHHPRKNLQLVLEAYASKGTELPPLLVLGGLGAKAQKFIKDSGLEEQIQSPAEYFSGEKLAHIYGSAKALIYPSLFEGFGLPVLEAMKCGCPVIGSQLSSIPEVGGEAIMYCDPYKVESLLEAMEILTQDEAEKASFSKKALQRASQFSPAKHIDQTLDIYQKLLL